MNKGEELIKSSGYRFRVENVSSKIIGGTSAVNFKISPKIDKHPKGFSMFCYCTVFQDIKELDLEDGDSISLGSIDKIKFVNSQRNNSTYCYVTLSDITVHKRAAKEDTPQPGVGVLSDEPAPPDFDDDGPLPFDL